MLEVWSSWLNLGHVFAGSAKTMEPVAEPLTKTSGLEGAWCFCDLAGSQLKTLKTARINSMLQTKLQLQPSCPPRFSILPLFIFWLHVIASLRRLGLDAYLLSFQATPVGVFMSCGGVSFFFPREKHPSISHTSWGVTSRRTKTHSRGKSQGVEAEETAIFSTLYDTWCHSPKIIQASRQCCFFEAFDWSSNVRFAAEETKRKDTSAPCFSLGCNLVCLL